MPSRPARHLAAGVRPPTIHRRQQRQAYDRKRGREQPWRALYKDPRWERARQEQFERQPLCERHLVKGEVVGATVVNHRLRHRGDEFLFFNPTNLESVCKRCHDREIQREEVEFYRTKF